MKNDGNASDQAKQWLVFPPLFMGAAAAFAAACDASVSAACAPISVPSCLGVNLFVPQAVANATTA